MKDEVENIEFNRFVKQAIPFEFIALSELYERCRKSEYDLSVPHRIAFHALIIVTKGKGTHHLDFHTADLYPGIIVPITKGQVHGFAKKLTVEGIVISFDESFLTQYQSEKSLFHFLQLYHSPRVFLSQEHLANIDPYLTLLRKANEDSNLTLKAELINSIFMTLLFQIKRYSSDQHATVDTKRFRDFILFKELLSTHYHQSHNAKEYSIKLAVSYKYLNDVCKEVCNMTAKSFIDSWLLLEIKRIISENKYSSQEIAYKMGYNEPSNFIRFFKKQTGLTPSQYLTGNIE